MRVRPRWAAGERLGGGAARDNGRVPTYRDEGIVLRTHKLGEADRIVTMLTRDHGKVRAVGKGVRRTSSRFGARLEPFMVVDAQFYEGRTFDIVNQMTGVNGPGSRRISWVNAARCFVAFGWNANMCQICG